MVLLVRSWCVHIPAFPDASKPAHYNWRNAAEEASLECHTGYDAIGSPFDSAEERISVDGGTKVGIPRY